MTKKNKKNRKLLVVIVIILLISSVYYFKVLKKDRVPSSESQGGLELNACISDSEGNCLSVIPTLTTVTFEGEKPTVGARYITLFSTLTAIGTVPEININSISGNPSKYNSEIISQMTTQFKLLQGQTDEQSVTLDFTSLDIPFGLTTFEMTVDASFFDAQGNIVSVIPVPIATVSILKEKDTCDDGTPWGECNPNNKPKYCEPGLLWDPPQEYQQGNIIDKASVCECPVDYFVDPTNPDLCLLNACSDGTMVGQCVSPAPESNLRYCDSTRMLIEQCMLCGCTSDYYGNPSIGCSVDDLCEYQDYSGTVDVSIGGSGVIPPPSGYVIFRTTDLTYISGSAVGYTSVCGSVLTQFGRTSGACTVHYCDDTDYILTVPGSPVNTYLWMDGDDVCICEPTDIGVHTYSRRYTTTDSDATLVSNSASSIDPSMELIC